MKRSTPLSNRNTPMSSEDFEASPTTGISGLVDDYNLKSSPFTSTIRAMESEDFEDALPTAIRGLLDDYNLKSPSSLKIRSKKRVPIESSLRDAVPSSSTTPQVNDRFLEGSRIHETPQSRREKALSFTEDRPFSVDTLMTTPNRFSTSMLPPMVSSLSIEDDDELDYVDVKRGSSTPLLTNSNNLSLFSTPNVNTPSSIVQQTPSTSTQPQIEDTAADIAPPPSLNVVHQELKSSETISTNGTVEEVISGTRTEREELEVMKLEALRQGREAKKTLLMSHNWILGTLAIIIAIPLTILDTFGFYYWDKWYGLTFVVYRVLADIYPSIIDMANYYEIGQKRQGSMTFIFPIMSFGICIVLIFSLTVYLLSVFLFDSKWKHTCRENDKSTLSRIESIELQNQTCNN